MLKRFFDTSEVDNFADSILSEVKRALPLNAKPKVARKVGARADKLDALITKKVAEFVKATKLNVYKKARLTARIRQGMSSLGYSERFVKSFSLDLLARIEAVSRGRHSEIARAG
jgi:hypothetical protein